MTLRSLNSPTPTPEGKSSPPSSSVSSSSSLSSSSTLILWYCVTISCLIVAVLWARYYRIRLQRQRQEAVLQLASIIMHNRRAVAGEDVESGRGMNNVENNNNISLAVMVGESSSSYSMELIERAMFGPDEADDIFSNARSALALSSAAAAIAERSSSFRRPWNDQNRRLRSQNFDRIEASVLAAHQMLDRLEAEHRRRKKEKYMKLVRALGCTSMIVCKYQLVRDDYDDDDTQYKIRDKDDSSISQPGEIMDANHSDENDNVGIEHDGDGLGANLEQEESIIGASSVPTTPVSPSAWLPTNNLNNTLRVVEDDCSSMDVENDGENKHDVLLIPLCTESIQHDATTTGTTSSSVDATKSNIHRNVPSTCAICLMQYKVGSHVSWSSNEECVHVFHRDCILLWLLKKRTSGDERQYVCPCCRREFVSESMLFNVNDAPTRTVGD